MSDRTIQHATRGSDLSLSPISLDGVEMHEAHAELSHLDITGKGMLQACAAAELLPSSGNT